MHDPEMKKAAQMSVLKDLLAQMQKIVLGEESAEQQPGGELKEPPAMQHLEDKLGLEQHGDVAPEAEKVMAEKEMPEESGLSEGRDIKSEMLEFMKGKKPEGMEKKRPKSAAFMMSIASRVPGKKA